MRPHVISLDADLRKMDAGRDGKGDAQGPQRQSLSYTYNIYHKLIRYHLDGRLKIGNLEENQIWDITVERKNRLFYGTDSLAEDAVVIYSMMVYCKAADVGFRQWLIFFLNNVYRYDDNFWKSSKKNRTLF